MKAKCGKCGEPVYLVPGGESGLVLVTYCSGCSRPARRCTCKRQAR